MHITEHIYLVGSGSKWGFGISHPIDCNVYLIDSGAGLVLIDSGVGINTERIYANIRAHGFELRDIKALLLTHYHGDHACGAGIIHAKTGCAVYAPKDEARAIETGDEQATSLAGAKGTLYPKDFVYPNCPGVIGLEHGQAVTVGDITLRTFHVPGHSLCDAVYLSEIDGKQCLFSGDAVFAHGQVLIQSLYDVNVHAYSQAMQRLAEQEIDALFPGHGVFTLEDGASHVKLCAQKFASGLVPQQLYYFT